MATARRGCRASWLENDRHLANLLVWTGGARGGVWVPGQAAHRAGSVEVDSIWWCPRADKVEVTVTANGKTPQYLPCSLISDCKLPWEVGVVEATSGAGSIEIVATGYLNGLPIVSETADLSFVEGKSMLLKLFLAAECPSQSLHEYRATCTRGGTCVDKVRKPTDLTPFVPSTVGGTGGGGGSGGGTSSGGNSVAAVRLSAAVLLAAKAAPAAVVALLMPGYQMPLLLSRMFPRVRAGGSTGAQSARLQAQPVLWGHDCFPRRHDQLGWGHDYLPSEARPAQAAPPC